MIGNAASDFVLALACVWIMQTRRQQPGLVVAAFLIGLAASLGVLRYSGVEVLPGPHQFASALSACAAFPLLAYALRYPDDPIAAQLTGAIRFALLLGGLGIGLTVAGVSQWGPAVAVISALVIAWTMVAARNPVGTAGAALLLAGMAATVIGRAGNAVPLFNPVVVLHLCLAAGLAALAIGSLSKQIRTQQN
jgi:hypothetical protein